MYMCEDGHDEIVYDGRYQVDCPLCEANSKIEELEREADDSKKEVKELEQENDKLEQRIFEDG